MSYRGSGRDSGEGCRKGALVPANRGGGQGGGVAPRDGRGQVGRGTDCGSEKFIWSEIGLQHRQTLEKGPGI